MLLLILGLIVFLGIHSVRIVAPQWRDARLAAMGESGWKGVYSLVSLAGLVMIVWGFSIARGETGMLYYPPAWTRHIAMALMLFAFVALMVSVLPAGRLKPALKHPTLVSTKAWAVAHLLVNGETSSVILFGAILAWAVWDRISEGRRNSPLPAPGPVKWDVISVVGGVALFALFVWWLHEWLIGVPVLA